MTTASFRDVGPSRDDQPDAAVARKVAAARPFICALCLILAALLFFANRETFSEGFESLSWPSTSGTLIASGYHGQHESSYDPAGDYEVWLTLSYGYSVLGHHYYGTRYDAASDELGRPHVGSTAEELHLVIAARGSHPRVYYDPRAPERALLAPGLPYMMFSALGIVVLVGVGIGWQVSTLGGFQDAQSRSEHVLHAGAEMLIWAAGLLFVGHFGWIWGASVLSAELLGTLPPWWWAPAVYGAWLLFAVLPRLARSRVMSTGLAGLALLGIGFTVVGGVLRVKLAERTFHVEHEFTIEQTRAALISDNPHIAEHRAWQLMRSPIPEVVVALGQCLGQHTGEAQRACAAAAGALHAAGAPLLPRLEAIAEQARQSSDEASRKMARTAGQSVAEIINYLPRAVHPAHPKPAPR